MPPYSYRNDPNVPAFDDATPIAFMDGACALCAFGARLILALDKTGDIRICPVQTPLGRAMLQHYGFTVDDPEFWLYLESGMVHEGFDAAALGSDPILRDIASWIQPMLQRTRAAVRPVGACAEAILVATAGCSVSAGLELGAFAVSGTA